MGLIPEIKRKRGRPRKATDKFTQPEVVNRENYNKILDNFMAPQTAWTVQSVKGALDSHDLGQFSATGRLCDAVLRDARVQSVLNTRILGVLGLPFSWKKEENSSLETSPEYNSVADTTEKKDLVDFEYYWDQMIPQSILSEIMKNVILMGFSIASVNWTSESLENGDKRWIPELHVFHASNTYYNTVDRRFMVITYNQGVMEVDPTDERFIIFSLLDNTRPWMSGAIRALAFPWLAKAFTLSDWRGYAGVHGNPLRVLTTTNEQATPPGGDVLKFIYDIATSARSGAPVQIPAGFTLDLLQSNAISSEIYSKLVDECNTDIALAIIGQNLTSEIKGGSYAAAKVHNDVRQEYIEADTTVLNTILKILVDRFYNYNYQSIPPSPFWDPQPPVNASEVNKALKEKADSIKTLSDAIVSMNTLGLGEKIDLIALCKEFGIPLK